MDCGKPRVSRNCVQTQFPTELCKPVHFRRPADPHGRKFRLGLETDRTSLIRSDGEAVGLFSICGARFRATRILQFHCLDWWKGCEVLTFGPALFPSLATPNCQSKIIEFCPSLIAATSQRRRAPRPSWCHCADHSCHIATRPSRTVLALGRTTVKASKPQFTSAFGAWADIARRSARVVSDAIDLTATTGRESEVAILVIAAFLGCWAWPSISRPRCRRPQMPRNSPAHSSLRICRQPLPRGRKPKSTCWYLPARAGIMALQVNTVGVGSRSTRRMLNIVFAILPDEG